MGILPRPYRQSISESDIMSDDVLRHLRLGFIRLHVLYHADKEPICGVELIEELRHHGYEIGPGTLYPVLHQIEEAGLLSSVDEVVEGKRRKNVRITPPASGYWPRPARNLRSWRPKSWMARMPANEGNEMLKRLVSSHAPPPSFWCA